MDWIYPIMGNNLACQLGRKVSFYRINMEVSLFDLVSCLSDAVDLINPNIMSHHQRVSYIACNIGCYLEIGQQSRENLFISSLLHDIGAIAATFEEKQELEQFEIVNPHKHAILGYLLTRSYQPFEEIARIIKYHHAHWNGGKGQFFAGHDVPLESYIIHLSDRVDILCNRTGNILDQTDFIRNKIAGLSKDIFVPKVVDAFLKVSERESFWLDIVSPRLTDIIKSRVELPVIQTEMDHLREIAKLFSHIIDFRSGFTASHSSGVASTAELLGKLSGLSKQDSCFLGIAGYLHDLGKLIVPNEILNKPEVLNREELNVIKQHTYNTHQILGKISIFSDISRWAANHHEKLDGSGYPYHYSGNELDLGSRIMAVADIFTALTEDRPYRSGMEPEQVKTILKTMVSDGKIDGTVVATLLENYERINQSRIEAQRSESELYKQFWDQAREMIAGKSSER